MSAEPVRASRARTVDEGLVRAIVLALAAYHLALGLYMVVAAGSFFDHIGPFGARNDHYTRDNATIYLAFGVGLFVAARRPSWRVPVLAVVALQYGFHVINHIVDVDEADPGWLGPFDAVSLALLGTFIAWLWWRSERDAAP